MKTALILMFMMASPGMARAGKPCDKAFVLVDGKLYEYDVYNSPDFNPRTSPTAAMCDADAVPSSELEEIMRESNRLPLVQAELEAEKERRAADKVAADRELASRDKFIEVLEGVKTPTPKSTSFFESFGFGVTVGVVTSALLFTLFSVVN